MLATETAEITEYLKSVLVEKFNAENIKNHFVETHDTLCYATNENQDATYGLLQTDADLAIVVGGYNSSNTSHLVELCERKFPTYFISSEKEIENETTIHHFDYHNKKQITTTNFLQKKSNLKIIITSGASCPDSALDGVIHKLNSFIKNIVNTEEVLHNLKTYTIINN
jgi:4-hydroxy-3-methylbut-2-enyl diphosphate reductase